MGKQKSISGKLPTNGHPPAADGSSNYLSAYFLSLSLENVRCFGPKQTLDLSDGHSKPARWTIILGVNGTGKTTLLQALVGFEFLQSENFARPSAFPRPRYHKTPLENRQFLRLAGKEAVVTARIASTQGITALPTRVADLNCTVGPNEKAQVGEFQFFMFGLWCCAYGAGRRVGTASLSAEALDDSTASLFSDQVDLRNPEEWLLRLDYAAAKGGDSKAQQMLVRAKELLLDALPDIDGIRITTTTGQNPTPRVRFETPYGWVPLRQLGYGYQTLITWVADLANRMAERYPDSPNPLAEPAVVLVDEIDLHLHPKWQRKLMGFLTERFPNTQFIATAHSPLVAQAAADANLAVLRREGDHVVIDNEVDNIRNWRIDQILTSDLFGLETARPPQVEVLILERNKLLDKPKLTATDKRRLKQLDAEIGELPYGETAQERKEREEIRKTLDLLMKERKRAQ